MVATSLYWQELASLVDYSVAAIACVSWRECNVKASRMCFSEELVR